MTQICKFDGILRWKVVTGFANLFPFYWSLLNSVDVSYDLIMGEFCGSFRPLDIFEYGTKTVTFCICIYSWYFGYFKSFVLCVFSWSCRIHGLCSFWLLFESRFPWTLSSILPHVSVLKSMWVPLVILLVRKYFSFVAFNHAYMNSRHCPSTYSYNE